MRASLRHWVRDFSISALVVAALAACDSGGDGGGKTVDCAKIPTAPACKPDVSGDVFVPGDGGSCSVGARRCVGQIPEFCQGGSWVAQSQCPASQACTNGACVDTSNPGCCDGMECGTDCGVSCGTCSGNTQCSEGQCVPTNVCVPQCTGKECGPNGCGGSCGTCNPNESCQNGQCVGNQTCSCNGALCGEDNCGNPCGTCADGAECVAGRCEGGNNGTGDSCLDIVDCIYDDAVGCVQLPDEQVDACAQACVLKGTTTAQAEFEAYLACASSCGADDQCFVMSCSDEQSACVFDKSGNGTCVGILDCFDTCADTDDACFQGCWEGATPEAQAALVGYSNCLDFECPDAQAGDPCIDDAAAGACADFVDACLAN